MHTFTGQFFLAAAIGCAVLGCIGCTTVSNANDSMTFRQNGEAHPLHSDSEFISIETAFRDIATREHLTTDSHTLFRLAVDSTVERLHFRLTGDLVIVRAEYFGQSEFGIRGAQGQGNYYAFQTRANEWKPVGIFRGNSYSLLGDGDAFQIITRWHYSASESLKTVYTWNGQLFE